MKYHSSCGFEHISDSVIVVLSNTLDKMVSNFGKDVVMKEYIEPVLKEKNSSQYILDFLYKIMLSSDIK